MGWWESRQRMTHPEPATSRRSGFAGDPMSARWSYWTDPQFLVEDGRMSQAEALTRMIDDLRRMRDQCEPKANTNPTYLHFSGAISNLKWLIERSGELK